MWILTPYQCLDPACHGINDPTEETGSFTDIIFASRLQRLSYERRLEVARSMYKAMLDALTPEEIDQVFGESVFLVYDSLALDEENVDIDKVGKLYAVPNSQPV